LPQKTIPREKLICAIGNYGYDWVERPKNRKLARGLKDVTVSVQEAWLAARDSKKTWTTTAML
jgi:spore germination protein YaaH